MGIGAAISAVAAAIWSLGTTVGLVTYGWAGVINAALSIGLSYASQAIRGRPKGPEKIGRSGMVRSAIEPHAVVLGKVRKGGLLAYANTSSEGKNNFLFLVVVWAAHQCKSITKLHFGGQEVIFDGPDGAARENTQYWGYAWSYSYLGSPSQVASGPLTTWTADHNVVASRWGATKRLAGRAYSVYKLFKSPQHFPSFIPNMTALIEGVDTIYDPRSASSAYSENPALQAAWILETFLGIPRARIDAATLIASANVCDEMVATLGGTEKRYRSCGFFQLKGEPGDWLDPVKAAMAGEIVEHDGYYYIHAGYYVAPVATITPDDLAGDFQRDMTKANLDRANQVKGTFVGEITEYQPAEFPLVRDAAFVAEDNGVELPLEVDLEFCPTPSQAQRVANIILQRQRMDETVEIDVCLAVGLDVKAWDAVTLDLDIFGCEGVYQILDHKLIIEPGGGDSGPRAFVRMSLKKHSSAIYNWNAATQEKAMIVPIALQWAKEGADQTTTFGNGDPAEEEVEGEDGSMYVDVDTGNVWVRGHVSGAGAGAEKQEKRGKGPFG